MNNNLNMCLGEALICAGSFYGEAESTGPIFDAGDVFYKPVVILSIKNETNSFLRKFVNF